MINKFERTSLNLMEDKKEPWMSGKQIIGMQKHSHEYCEI